MKRIIVSFCFILCTVCALAQVDLSEQKISILLGHRYSGGFNPKGYEQYDYTGLFKVGNSYYLKPTKLKVETALDKCSGDSIFTIKATSKGDCLFLFWGLKPSKGAIETHFIASNRRFVLPQKNYVFSFNNKQYSFVGEGEINIDVINDYRLVLFNENLNQQQILVDEEILDNSKVEVLFIGDLDADGKPDFIIDAPPYAQTRNILLLLSSHAKNNELVHCISQQFDWFDCDK